MGSVRFTMVGDVSVIFDFSGIIGELELRSVWKSIGIRTLPNGISSCGWGLLCEVPLNATAHGLIVGFIIALSI
jgi:hypothetical protein